MKHSLLFLLLLAVVGCNDAQDAGQRSDAGVPNLNSSAARSVPKVILDGDVGPDPCDFGTLAMAHNLHRSGEIELLGFMATLPEPSNVEVIDVLNRWYGHDLPIGVFKDHNDQGYNLYVQTASTTAHELFPASRVIAGHYAHWAPRSHADVPGSTALYRQLLSSEADHSVTILAVGQLYNLKALLNSGPDEYSALTGMELVQAKVDRIVTMIGGFAEPISPEDIAYYQQAYLSNPPNTYGLLTVALHTSTGNGYGAEYNAHAWYPGLTQNVFEKLNALDLPKVIIGHEPGWRVPVGAGYNDLDIYHPVRMAYYENNIPSKQIHPYLAKNDPGYDELALLYLARGAGRYFDELSGHAVFEHPGTSTWHDEPKYQHTRLALTPTANADNGLSDLIERLVMGDVNSWQAPLSQ